MSHLDRRATVAVLLGGNSSEREVSLMSGRTVVQALDPRFFRVKVFDPAIDIPRIVRHAASIDVAVVMLHGRGGEDGSLQGLLDLLGIPYQCSGVLGCALAMHKAMAKDRFRQAGLPVAPDLVLERAERGDAAERVSYEVGLPVVIKPVTEGSSYGITIVKEEGQLQPALDKAFALDRQVLAESFLSGRELTCGVIGDQSLEALPLVEIIPGDKYDFFDYQAKYQPGASQEICPAELEEGPTAAIQDLARRAHRALGLQGYSRSDFILTSQGPFILETNTVPGMTPNSLLPKAARAAGMELPRLMERLIRLALERAGRPVPWIEPPVEPAG